MRNGKVNIYHNYVQDLAKSIELFLPYIDLKDKVIGDWIDNPTFNEPNPDRPNLNDYKVKWLWLKPGKRH